MASASVTRSLLGYGVLVQCTRSSARDLGADLPPARGDDALRAAPVEALRTRPEPAEVPDARPGDQDGTVGPPEPVETTDPTTLFDRTEPGRHQAVPDPPDDPPAAPAPDTDEEADR